MAGKGFFFGFTINQSCIIALRKMLARRVPFWLARIGSGAETEREKRFLLIKAQNMSFQVCWRCHFRCEFIPESLSRSREQIRVGILLTRNHVDRVCFRLNPDFPVRGFRVNPDRCRRSTGCPSCRGWRCCRGTSRPRARALNPNCLRERCKSG